MTDSDTERNNKFDETMDDIIYCIVFSFTGILLIIVIISKICLFYKRNSRGDCKEDPLITKQERDAEEAENNEYVKAGNNGNNENNI